VSDDEPAFSAVVKLQRGTKTDDRDTLKISVEAHDIEQLDHRIEAVRERSEQWAAEFRSIQPQRGREVADDQRELGEVNA
jgi:hypothetical protein